MKSISQIVLWSILGGFSVYADVAYAAPANNTVLSWNIKDNIVNNIKNNYLIFKQTAFVSCGPYKILLKFKKKKIDEPLSRQTTLIEIGPAGKLLLKKDGHLAISRSGENRYIPIPEKKSVWNFLQLDTNNIHTLEMGWTGKTMYAEIDNTNTVSMPRNGTKLMGVLRINTAIIDPSFVSVTCP